MLSTDLATSVHTIGVNRHQSFQSHSLILYEKLGRFALNNSGHLRAKQHREHLRPNATSMPFLFHLPAKVTKRLRWLMGRSWLWVEGSRFETDYAVHLACIAR
ncbi:hypothetical protein AVEN_196399-1 [Araneus ventricosus]|uniref:Uncharacterized protein n=1 Tax=Araneus ventricosus TaxID=182803 RepID=A0A4Y2AWM2_ARAVE|nr:hypothetical protein AVEN_196399-1 [Araneus ventricosus]